jgi:MFS family permease
MTSPLGLLTRLQPLRRRYPPQFWLLFWGMLLNAAAGSMVWPFLTIYVRQQLGVPMTTVALLLTVNAVAGFAGLSVAGPAADRFGRKPVILASLTMQAVAMIAMSFAASLPAWIATMAALGGFGPLFRVGADSTVADLLPPPDRAEGYALLRMISNLGVAVGPALGGFITSLSYDIAFFASAGASLIFAGLVWLRARETLPSAPPDRARGDGSYAPVLRDRPFLLFVAVYALSGMSYTILMVLLPVYVKENFGVVESQYGFIMATNAAMVVAFQFAVTRRTSRWPPLLALALGSLFYASGTGSVALGSTFWGFWLSMVVLTVGEMIMVPTSTTLTANLAPPEMRGRYMGLYTLTWGISLGLGPVVGGLLNDRVSPQATWIGAAGLALLAAGGFAALTRSGRLRPGEAPAAA